MTTKENIIIYKNRIKNEIDNLDPSEKDDYLISECVHFEDYRSNNYISSESEQEIKSLLEYDRIVLILKDRMEQERIIKKAEKAEKRKKEKDDWKNATVVEKLVTIALGAGILFLMFWAIY